MLRGRCEQFFMVDNVPYGQKVSLVSIYLFDIALVWHRQFMRLIGDIVPWLVYRGAIMQRFGNSFDDPLVELKNCKFETSLEDYQNAYDKLLSMIDISEEQAISFYMAHLLILSCLLELSRFNTYTSGTTINSPKPLALPAPNERNKSSTSQTILLMRRLTQKELEETRAKNQCFYCDQKYTPGHTCIGQLYLLEVIEDNDELDSKEEFLIGARENRGKYEQVLEELPHISLHALNGVHNYQTMRVVGFVGKFIIHIVIDTGSTHNFVND
ncbi:hypothetical protein Tco_1580467 [Tanacetum coccineum]